MSPTRRLRPALAASALVVAALALGWAGGWPTDASDGVAAAVGDGTADATLETSGPAPPAVTVGADERVDARADRWRQGALLALLAVAVAVPLLSGRGLGAPRRGPSPGPGRWSPVAARAPPGRAPSRALARLAAAPT